MGMSLKLPKKKKEQPLQAKPLLPKPIRRNVLTVILVLILFLVAISFFNKPSNVKPKDTVNVSGSTSQLGCTRTTRLENAPQYDRALSLISQRVQSNVDFWNKYGKTETDKEQMFKYFPSNLTNCIKINEAKLNNGTEGFFVLHSKDIKPNYYPVTVDTGYMFTDDAETALLLTHEITHVQQYIDSVNNKTKLVCLDDEVSAFMSQLDFYVELNTEENKSVWLMMQETEHVNPQIQMIKNMITINQQRDPSLCDILDKKCRYTYLSLKLRTLISKDEQYKKECANLRANE